MLKRMASAGLVTRERDPADERVLLIRPTAAAQALKRRLAKTQNEVVCRSGLSPAEFAALRDTLHKLTGTITAGAQQDAA